MLEGDGHIGDRVAATPGDGKGRRPGSSRDGSRPGSDRPKAPSFLTIDALLVGGLLKDVGCHLTSLVLLGANLHDVEAGEALATGLSLNRSLRMLVLGHCRCHPDGMAAILTAIKAHNFTLRHLALDTNPLGEVVCCGKLCGDIVADYFGDQFGGMQTLWLGKMGLADEDGVPIGRALGSGICHLTHLVLSENFLGDEAGCAIARGLPKARSLIDLNLNSNRLSSIAAFDIIRALLTNRVVRRVSMDLNLIKDDVLHDAEQVLETNNVLVELSMAENMFRPHQAEQYADLCVARAAKRREATLSASPVRGGMAAGGVGTPRSMADTNMGILTAAPNMSILTVDSNQHVLDDARVLEAMDSGILLHNVRDYRTATGADRNSGGGAAVPGGPEYAEERDDEHRHHPRATDDDVSVRFDGSSSNSSSFSIRTSGSGSSYAMAEGAAMGGYIKKRGKVDGRRTHLGTNYAVGGGGRRRGDGSASGSVVNGSGRKRRLGGGTGMIASGIGGSMGSGMGLVQEGSSVEATMKTLRDADDSFIFDEGGKIVRGPGDEKREREKQVKPEDMAVRGSFLHQGEGPGLNRVRSPPHPVHPASSPVLTNRLTEKANPSSPVVSFQLDSHEPRAHTPSGISTIFADDEARTERSRAARDSTRTMPSASKRTPLRRRMEAAAAAAAATAPAASPGLGPGGMGMRGGGPAWASPGGGGGGEMTTPTRRTPGRGGANGMESPMAVGSVGSFSSYTSAGAKSSTGKRRRRPRPKQDMTF